MGTQRGHKGSGVSEIEGVELIGIHEEYGHDEQISVTLQVERFDEGMAWFVVVEGPRITQIRPITVLISSFMALKGG